MFYDRIIRHQPRPPLCVMFLRSDTLLAPGCKHRHSCNTRRVRALTLGRLWCNNKKKSTVYLRKVLVVIFQTLLNTYLVYLYTNTNISNLIYVFDFFRTQKE